MSADSAATVDQLLLEQLETAELPTDAYDLLLSVVLGQSDQTPSPPTADLAPLAAYLSRIEVRGFRGIGEPATLDLVPGPGLTVVTGRNGSGKSTFAEAAELTLTGDEPSWARQGPQWREGWRNLHVEGERRITVGLSVDGHPGGAEVVCRWAAEADLEQRTTFLQRAGQTQQGVADLGWDGPMRLFRPFLSYADLGKLLHGKPSEMHDSLHNVLGLGRLADVENRLKTVRRDSDLGRKHAANDLPALREALADHPDDRARAAEQLLALSTVDLEALEKLASGAETDGHDNDVVSSLEALAALILPGREELAANVTRLREAAARVAELSQTPAGEARRLADLLRDALRHQQHHPHQPCPVCGGRVLDDAWTARAQEQITRLEEEAAHLTHAHQALQQARQAVRQMAHTAPPVLTAPAPGLEIDLVALRNAWRDWEGLGSAETDGLIEGALARFDAVAVALSPTRDAAERALEKRRAAWQPMADRLREWVGTERRSRQAAQTYVAARKAVEWLVSVGEQIRNKRLAPMATEARKIWAALRQDSNVDLGVVTLAGTGNRRRVNLNLAVDGEADAALGVMSQGELHALALALFLPRATAAASPLRFLLIDDPVQSLDPSKVQGLARVLEAAAADRQVIVFTHDDRLPTAIRHLGINAHLRVVSRRERSQVTVINDAHGDPARRHLAAARGVALDEKLDQALQTKVVCVLVRQAIEAKCHDLVLIDGARRGRPVAELEDTLAATARLKQTLALALFGDTARAGDVNRRLRKLHPRAATVVDHVNRGSHGDPVPGDLTALVSDASTLIDRLEAR